MNNLETIIKHLKRHGITGCGILQMYRVVGDYVAVSGIGHMGYGMLSTPLQDICVMIDNLKFSSEESILQIKNFIESTKGMAVTARPIEQLPKILLEKKPKYIRQQHKLAQRHYRRK